MSVNACTRNTHIYIYTHIHVHETQFIHLHMHLCWVVPCSITDVVAAYDLAVLLDSDTGLLHTTFDDAMFIFTIHNTDVLCICNCNACCPESVAHVTRSSIGRTHTHAYVRPRARFNLVAFIFNMICFPGTDMLYLRLWLRGK